MRTYMAKPGEIEKKWYIIDAKDKTLGRLATEVATLLKGKHKPVFTPNVDVGDFVIIINAEKVVLTGNKLTQKKLYSHSGYPGGIRETNYQTLLEKQPEKVLEHAVKGMLPHNSLGRDYFRKLHVYAGDKHPHSAQKPQVWEF